MMLPWLLLIPLACGILAWLSERLHPNLPRLISIAGLIVPFGMVAELWFSRQDASLLAGGGPWLAEVSFPWIPQWGVSIHIAMDGMSLLLVALTFFLGGISVVSSWIEVKERVGFFHLNLMAILTGITGVFLSLDLFLFYFFWELMLVPMYFLILLWGHENRRYAAMKFFIFTQMGGLLMLLSILGLYFIHGSVSGEYTFDYSQLLGTPVAAIPAFWLMMGFVAAFAVKLPVVPLHTWLPDAHTEAPTAGSVILAGLLLKTGAYGLMRFAVPLFPSTAGSLATPAMVLGVVGILYGAVMAFSQTDLKRLVAYTSVSHMGFVLLGVFAWNTIALQGVMMQIICHGVGTGALFIIAGMLQERLHTRDMARMSGLRARLPRMAGVAVFFALASLGLPGLGNFVGEFLVLLGAFRVSMPVTASASAGFIFAAVYSLRMIQKVFHGPALSPAGEEAARISDLSPRESFVMGIMIISLVWMGLFPQSVLDTAGNGIDNLRRAHSSEAAHARPHPDAVNRGDIHDSR